LSEELTQVNKRFSEGRPVDDSAEGRTLQDCAGEHRPGLNASIMLHLGTALRAFYDGLSSPPVPHDVINAAVLDRQARALSACDPRELRPESFVLGRQLDPGEQLGALAENG